MRRESQLESRARHLAVTLAFDWPILERLRELGDRRRVLAEIRDQPRCSTLKMVAG